ncbi:MAG: transcriptional regulator [Rhodobacteraceae bacterium]|nr:transcriptional regulator [Paracoccaceae bacterium]
MPDINHHLNEKLLLGYATGSLPEAFNLVIATHVSLCDECRAQVESYEALGGEVLQKCGTVDVSKDALSATLAKIDAGRDVEMPVPISNGVFPTPLHGYVNGDLDAVHWRKIGGGVSQAILKTSRTATVRLLRIPAGTELPDHGHRGTEMTLVLKGAFCDEHDRFARGDIEIADEDVQHTPIAEEGEDCICLAASDAPLRFTGLLPRIMQPFARI